MNVRQTILFIALSILFPHFLVSQIEKQSPQEQSYPHVPGKLIIKIREGYPGWNTNNLADIEGFQAIMQHLGVRQIKRVFPHHLPPPQTRLNSGHKYVDLTRIYELSYSEALSAPDAANLFNQHEAVAYAEPFYLYETFYNPNDPYLDTTGGNTGEWYLNQIKAREAWDYQRGDSTIMVAIIDSGSDNEQPDMQDNLALNHDDPIDGQDNDGDGYIDNYYGWDFGGDSFEVPGDNNPFLNGQTPHGLQVASIVGATADNNIGSAGASFNCRYLPIKASTDDFSNLIAYGYQGIVYAVDHGAQIINCSWGGRVRSLFGYDVVRYATINKGAAIIAAAGNGTGTATADQTFYPAAFDMAISVANTSFEDVIYVNSTYNYTVDVSAPGRGITSVVSGGYGTFAGTSAASPVAASEAAIILAYFPTLTGFQAAQRMRVTTDRHYDANEVKYLDKMGTGRINMLRALTDPLKPSIRSLAYDVYDQDNDGKMGSGDTLLIELDCINYLHASSDLQIDLEIPDIHKTYIEALDTHQESGVINMWESFSLNPGFRIRLHPSTPEDYQLELKITYRDTATAYEDFEYISFRVNSTWLDIDINQFRTSVTSDGNFGFNDFGSQEEGLGVAYRYSDNALFEGGFLIGNSSSQVSDRIRNSGFIDMDFQKTDAIYSVPESSVADFESVSTFRDNAAPNPLGVQITQRSFAYKDPENTDFVIFQYIIKNEQSLDLTNLYAGLFADWDIYAGLSNLNACNYTDTAKLAYAWDATGTNTNYYGMGVLSDGPFYSLATYLPGPFHFTTADKFAALTNIPTSQTASVGTQGSGKDIAHFVSTGPFDVQSGLTDTVAFVVMGGQSLEHLHEVKERAQNKYHCQILGKGPNNPFSISHEIAPPGFSILFQDTNTGAQSWSWDFGDGNTSNITGPLHSYSKKGTYTVTLTVSDGNCTYTSSQDITISDNVAVDPPLEATSVRFHPNPSNGNISLIIEGEGAGRYDFSLINISGQEVFSQEISKNHHKTILQISMPDVPAGLYLIRLKGDDLQYYEKLRIE